jgi:UDP-2,4-diacetamido-2,4,6-trideoxy-beta-L-altropyranose hydrolase
VNVVFRTDASSRIGSGHVMRCLTLGTALRERGASVSFACREHEGHLCDLIAERGFAVTRLPKSTAKGRSEDLPSHADWLGATWREDAAQVRALVAGKRIDWLVVDHYALDERWERELRPYAARILVIDDLADRMHDCDVLLDQNLVPDMDVRYGSKLPEKCTALLGPGYALLQPMYAELHDQVSPREGPIRRICIFLGGADGQNVTGRALAAFLSLERPDIHVDVIVAADSPHTESIRAQAARHRNVHLHGSMPTLANLYAQADLAIGGGGATTWERLCVGLPTLVVVMAENQRLIAETLSERGLVQLLGHQDTVDASAIAEALADLVRKGLDAHWSRRCLAVVDGIGVARTCAALAASGPAALRVRRAGLSDEALLLEWTNDSTTRRGSFSQEPVQASTHRAWLCERLSNAEGCYLFIVETSEGAPLGQVRFERSGQAWGVHFSLSPAFRGQGLGRPMLHAALCEFRSRVAGAAIVGLVKEENERSRRIFEALGFALQPSADDGVATYRRLV